MEIKNKLLIFCIFLFLLVFSSGIVFAQDSALPLVENGEVSGDVEITSVNPFTSTNGELVYIIPEGVTEIKSANVVVSSYSGSGAPTYGLTTNISLMANNATEVLEYANLTYSQSTANDPVIYPITDLTSKQYSDYQTLINITDKVKGLSGGDKITISVNNTPLSGYSFDGRIKLIALIFAYDGSDDDKVSYWLNIGQAWTKETLTTTFNTKEFDDDYEAVTLDSIALSSADATYRLNGDLLTEPQQETGSYYIADSWDITDKFNSSQDTNFTYTSSKASTYASYKAAIQLLKIYTLEKTLISASITPQYANTVFAGVKNILTVTVNSENKEVNGSVVLLIGDDEIASDNFSVDSNDSVEIELTDYTIRTLNESTVNGANYSKVTYTLNIVDDEGNILNSTNVTYNVLYNGYLGKDYAYPMEVYREIVRYYQITGDVIVLNSDDSAYMGTGATSRNETLTADYDGDVAAALLYISYNWDNVASGDFNTWNVTFNNATVTPLSSYRDQGNLGNYGNRGYGLVVYEVADLVKSGDNVITVDKISGKSAVYPSSLLILTENNMSKTIKDVYIAEDADLLANSYSKNLTVGSYYYFADIDLTKILNASLYVFAAGAQAGEGNIMFNNNVSSDVWSGSSNSVGTFELDITDIIDENDIVLFESTGSTIVALHQILVVESGNPITAVNKLTTEYTSVYTVQAGVNNTLTLTVTNDGTENATNVTVKVLCDNETIFETVIPDYALNSDYKFVFTDPTIRPIDENTVNGANYTFADYTVVVEVNGSEINSTDYSFPVLYNGNLGKDYAYPTEVYAEIVRNYTITGEVIVLNSDDSAYMGTGATSRNETLTADYDGDVVVALLYVAYNWDNVASGDFNTWNVTFNNATVTPLSSYRDQGNLGNYGNRGYGLVVYNVADLVKSGDNVISIEKISGKSAVYPSSLLILTDNNESETIKDVYIAEDADLLANSYSKNLTVGYNYFFDHIDLNSLVNASLYVFAAGAQAGEGNVVFNDNVSSDVWSGSSNSIGTFELDISDLVDEYSFVFFESTGSTILALHQIMVVESDNHIVIDAPDVEKYFAGSERFEVTLTDKFGNIISNESVQIMINGVSYNRTTDENGTASIALGLSSGVYIVTTTAGNVSVDSTVIISSTIQGDDIVKVFRNDTQYYATFTDSEGNPLANGTTVTFNINGVMYERKVNENGTARLNINLDQGTYILTAIHPDNKEMVSNTITVLPRITENSDLVKYYRNDSQYVVRIIGDDGNPVGANETVTFNINGVMYERKTNESGHAKLNINLQPGDYIITAMYGGCNVANNITVKPVLNATDITMTYKDGTQFKASLVDGQGNPLAGTNITFNINGVFYDRTTGSDGIAKLNINLMAGEYIITSMYNESAISNKITITN